MKAKEVTIRLAVAVLLIVAAFGASYLDTYVLYDKCYKDHYLNDSFNSYCALGFYVVRPVQFIILHPVLLVGLILSPFKVNPFIFLLLTPVVLVVYWFFVPKLLGRCLGKFCHQKHHKRK